MKFSANSKSQSQPNTPEEFQAALASCKNAGAKLAIYGFVAGAMLAGSLMYSQMSAAERHVKNVSIELGCAAFDRDRNFYWRDVSVAGR